MRKTHLKYHSILISFLIVGSNMQTLSAATPGIYKNISEYKQGMPSQSLDSFSVRKIKYGFWGLTSKDRLTFQRLSIDAKAARQMGKVFGFSDGEKLYVKTNKIRVFKISNFAQAESIGKYLYYIDIAYHFDSRLPFLWFSYRTERLIDKNSGKRIYLTVPFLKKLMAAKPELLQSFKKEKNQSRKLKEYLEAFYVS